MDERSICEINGDYIKGIKTSIKLMEEVKTWPLIDITTASSAPGKRFILRTDFTFKSATVVDHQASVPALHL